MPAKAAKKKNLSAIKRTRQAEKRNLRNASIRSKIKTVSKRIEEAITEKNQENVKKFLREIIRTVNSAVSKGVLHKNTASRKISRLSKLANTVLKAVAV
ncbi:MAG: 30S ribosomal protein S20 [Nitrospirae bacterium RBG_16_43_8]|nr:MAG: 30S ribosomal protein S20 [Nitrospirae bacterium RBG_16_43_8]